MKIHHYTNIESLALILKNKTIRFNRLDKVDDLEESSIESNGLNYTKNIFVSCWTEIDEESIPLWIMYGGGSRGVRITLEKEMFQEYEVGGEGTSIIHPIHMSKDSYFVVPISQNDPYKEGDFYRKIIYVDNVYEEVKDAIKVENVKDNGSERIVNSVIDTLRLAKYKHKRWSFQNEHRFVLQIFPFNPYIANYQSENLGKELGKLYADNAKRLNYFDLELKQEVIDSMEITLSPSATEGERVIIKALVDSFAPKAIVHESSLGSVVRLK